MPEAPYRAPQPPEPDPPRPLSPLERLAQEGAALTGEQRREQEQIAREERARRLEAALLPPLVSELQGAGLWLLGAGLVVPLLSAFASGETLWLMPALACAAALAAWYTRNRRLARQRPAQIEQALRWPATLPFAMTGYERWLVSDFGTIHVHFRGAIDQQLATLAVGAASPSCKTQWQGERHLKIMLPSKYLWSDGDDACLGGDPEALRQLTARVLLVFHAEVGLEKVELASGYLWVERHAS